MESEEIIQFIKAELRYALKIGKKEEISEFWKGRLFTLRRLLRIIKKGNLEKDIAHLKKLIKNFKNGNR